MHITMFEFSNIFNETGQTKNGIFKIWATLYLLSITYAQHSLPDMIILWKQMTQDWWRFKIPDLKKKFAKNCHLQMIHDELLYPRARNDYWKECIKSEEYKTTHRLKDYLYANLEVT